MASQNRFRRKNMEKPISIVIEEARQTIASAVNSVNLPPVLLEPIIKDVYNEVRQAEIRQYQLDKVEYNKYLQEEKSSAEEK